MLSFAQLQAKNLHRSVDKFGKEPDDYGADFWLAKLMEEVGELAKALHSGTIEEFRGEIGDVVIVADLLAQGLGENLEDCVRGAFDAKSKEWGVRQRLGYETIIGGFSNGRSDE